MTSLQTCVACSFTVRMGKPAACLMRLFQGFISSLMSFLRLEMHWNRFRSGHQEFTMRAGPQLRWNLWSPDNISTRSAPAFPSSFSFGFPPSFSEAALQGFQEASAADKHLWGGQPVSSNRGEIRSSSSGGPFSSAGHPNQYSGWHVLNAMCVCVCLGGWHWLEKLFRKSAY